MSDGIVPNPSELELNKKFIEILQTKNLTLLQLRYQLVALVVTIFSFSIGAVGLLLNVNSSPTKTPDFHLIYTILFLWILFSISLILVWRFITNLLHNEEYGYCQEIQKLNYLIGLGKTESTLDEAEKQEAKLRVNRCQRDPGIKNFEKWIFPINYVLFIIGIVFLLLNRADYDIFSHGYTRLLSSEGIFLIGISGFAIIFFMQRYLKKQTQKK